MWSVFKYVINRPNTQDQESPKTDEEIIEDVRLDNVLETIKNEVDNNAENYVIALHYLDFPVLIHYGLVKLRDTDHLKTLHEYLEPQKEIKKILLMDKADYVKGFYFLRNQIQIQQDILRSLDQQTFDKRAAESGLEPYVINDLRTIWKNRKLEYLQRSLVHQEEVYYRPDENHPLYQKFLEYLEDIYKRGVDRFKTFICIGGTFIGKSVFFTKFIVPERFYIYHSNYLEYSKMPNQPSKIFRILDDINWEQVTSTELKMLMNRNISSVNIKYGYEYIFPLIPIIIMNAEDYTIFRKHFSDIWEFVERNSVIYPEQNEGDVVEEKVPLFSDKRCELTNEVYLFNKILSIEDLDKCETNNMNEYIKNQLDIKESWKYNTTRYIQMPKVQPNLKIPNPEINKKSILKQYEEYILRKKTKEMAKEGTEDDKKPRQPWYREYYPTRSRSYTKTNSYSGKNESKKENNKIKDIDKMEDDDISGDDVDMDEDDDFEDGDDDYEEEGDDESIDEDGEGRGSFEKFKQGFIQI